MKASRAPGLLHLLASFVTLLLCASLAHAQGYPARPIRLICPFAPGGATDMIARSIAQRLTEQLGRAVIVENKSGGGGTIGAAEAARAPADGYTILIGEPGGLSIAVVTQKGLSYDPVRDFAAIAQVVSVPMALVGHPSIGANSLTELLASNSDPSEAEVRETLSGHLCRCTGYHNIVAAAMEAAKRMRAARAGA